jgi:alkanesulfonate monooxygenase SsuD/methylene tetrahydromethanopterin reductase-like flavin-dependent oxidoreductase (luciferase family)
MAQKGGQNCPREHATGSSVRRSNHKATELPIARLLEAAMHFGAFFYGTVDMPDAGVDGPPAHRRHYGQDDYRRAYSDLLAYAQHCDTLGYDSMWTAEHHFHHHGFEVVPNVLLLNGVLAQHTHRIRLGALIHVLTTWHPIHFAEDYALADVLSGGRLLCGLGRGTEERESHVFGVNVGYSNDATDLHNRAVFEEQVAIFKAATSNERFSYRGTYYTIPPEGLTFRGEPVTALPLVPQPITTPVRIYQPISSEETLLYAAHQRHVGVLANHPWERLVPWWRQYGAVVEEEHGVRLRPGEDRMLVVQLHIADSAGEAIRTARPGYDELTKLLWPNIIRRTPALASRPPFTLEERMASKSWIVGTPEQARDTLLEMQAVLGLEMLVIFPHLPGMRRRETLEQLGRFWAEVRPALAAGSARHPRGHP